LLLEGRTTVLTLIRSTLVAAVVALTGCAATVTKPADAPAAPLQVTSKPASVALLITGNATIQAAADWHTFRAEWRSAFSAAAAAAAITASYLESEPADQPAGTVLIRVVVNEYRYLTPGARFGFGVFTGNAFVDAEAEFVEFPARRSIGKRKYATTSSAWQGVFSAMTDKQVRALSDAMLKDLTSK
jgi:hypothetical protein